MEVTYAGKKVGQVKFKMAIILSGDWDQKFWSRAGNVQECSNNSCLTCSVWSRAESTRMFQQLVCLACRVWSRAECTRMLQQLVPSMQCLIQGRIYILYEQLMCLPCTCSTCCPNDESFVFISDHNPPTPYLQTYLSCSMLLPVKKRQWLYWKMWHLIAWTQDVHWAIPFIKGTYPLWMTELYAYPCTKMLAWHP